MVTALRKSVCQVTELAVEVHLLAATMAEAAPAAERLMRETQREKMEHDRAEMEMAVR